MSKQSIAAADANRRLKIGFVFDDSLDSHDGVAQYVKTVGYWLQKKDHKVSYFTGETAAKDWRGSIIYSLSKNVAVSFNGNKLSMPMMSDSKRIKTALIGSKPDILHVQMPYSPLMAGRLLKIFDGPAVGTFHIFPESLLPRLGMRLLANWYGNQLNNFNEILSVSTAAQEFAKSVSIPSRVVPNAVDVSAYKDAAAEQKQKTRIVFLGRLVKRKGCLQLLKAYKLAVKEHGLKAELIIAGKGQERQKLEDFVNRHKLSSLVSFRGFVDEKDKPSLLASADIACFPATGGESFGIVLIEAMAAGAKVVLGGDNAGYRSVLGQKPRLLVDPDNTPGFAKRLVELCQDTEETVSLSSWLKLEVMKYDIDIVGPQIEAAYYSAIAKTKQSHHNEN